jgi:glycogen(starch) synthase
MTNPTPETRVDRRLRIILAPSAYYPHAGGIEELTRQLALTLQSRGHEVSILTNRWPEGVAEHETLDGVRVARLRFPLPAANLAAVLRFALSGPNAARAFLNHVLRAKADVVHVIGAGPQAVYAGMLAPLLKTRIVFTAQGELTFDPQDSFRNSVVLRSGLRRILRRADAVTACSRFVLSCLPLHSTRRKPEVIPNGVTVEDFADISSSDSGSYVLAVGRLVPQKGFDVLLQAFAAASLKGLGLVIAGDGPEHERLSLLAGRLGIRSRVRLAGGVPRHQIPRLLEGAKMLVLPSRGEPFGIVLLEAMACGLPAIATDAGGVTDFARDGDNALLIPVDDPAALADAMRRIESDSALRMRLTISGRETAERMSWRHITPHYERLYKPPSRGT